MYIAYCVSSLHEKYGEIGKMGKLVKIVVCPECGSELKTFEATKFGNFLECCNCKNKVFVPADRACARPLLYAK
jgi:ssDNA-binding Zn-finger/Zn-ribbon topoisomerase 1